MDSCSTNQRHMQAKLIFNPSAGAARASPIEIQDVIHEMQAWKLVPEAFLVEPGCDLSVVVQNALSQGIRMFVVCGGDGTILAVAEALTGTRATLGIIPAGTQNNVALSLGIPDDIPAAVALLRTGRRIKVDMGLAACGKTRAALPAGLCGGAGLGHFPVGRRYPARQPGADRRLLCSTGRFPTGRDTPGAGQQTGDPHPGSRGAGLQHALHRPAFPGWRRDRVQGWLAGRAAFHRPFQDATAGLRRPEGSRGWDGRPTHPTLPGAAGWIWTLSRPCRSWQMDWRWEKGRCTSLYNGTPWR